MLRNGLAVAVVCALVAPATVAARADNLAPACPATLKTRQSATAPAGWTAYQQDFHGGELQTMVLSEGRFSADTFLMTDPRTVYEGNRTTRTWSLAGRKNVWLTCQYLGTEVVLARRIPDGVVQCQIVTDSIRGGDVVVSFSCHR